MLTLLGKKPPEIYRRYELAGALGSFKPVLVFTAKNTDIGST